MRLADFIENNMEAILMQWEAFARSLPAGKLLEADELRDHAEHMLVAICKDIRQAQTPNQQQPKSHGLAGPLDHGTADKAIKVVLTGGGGEVAFTVENEGLKIPQSRIAGMFAPLARGADQPVDSQNLGLGLYICREIALAHGGSIEGQADDSATSFTVRLPRDGRALPPRP